MHKYINTPTTQGRYAKIPLELLDPDQDHNADTGKQDSDTETADISRPCNVWPGVSETAHPRICGSNSDWLKEVTWQP